MTAASTRESLLIDHAAERAGVSRRTMYYWIARGKVQHFRTHGGSTRVYVDSLPNVQREARAKSIADVLRGVQ